MTEAHAAVLDLLEERGPDRTICPSEAARRLDPKGWRERMDDIHEAARTLAQEGRIRLSWKGKPKQAPEGPYRIAQGA